MPGVEERRSVFPYTGSDAHRNPAVSRKMKIADRMPSVTPEPEAAGSATRVEAGLSTAAEA